MLEESLVLVELRGRPQHQAPLLRGGARLVGRVQLHGEPRRAGPVGGHLEDEYSGDGRLHPGPVRPGLEEQGQLVFRRDMELRP